MPRDRRVLRAAGFAVFGALTVWAFWPPSIPLLTFYPDSFEYLNWPWPLVQHDVLLMGARPVGYPLLLDVTGKSVALGHLQTWLSLLSWTFLGWAIARYLGVAIALALAYSSPVRFWNWAVLTESVTFSVAAVLVGLATIMVRQERWNLFSAWLLLAAWFAVLRDANVALLPFLAAPFLLLGVRRFAIAMVAIAVIGGAATWHANHEIRWKAGLKIAIEARVVWSPDPEIRQYFSDHGMPTKPLGDNRKQFLEWIDDDVRSLYVGWLLSRPESYTRPPKYLFRGGKPVNDPSEDLADQLNSVFFKELQPFRGTLTTWADEVFRLLALPLPIALLLAVGAPLADRRMRGTIGVEAVWLPILVVAAVTQSFLAYNLSGSGHERHILLASLLYRLIPAFAVAFAWKRLTVR